MSARTCPDWPELMELDPDLQFKHYTVVEAQLPAEALRGTHWFDVHEWATSGPGANGNSSNAA